MDELLFLLHGLMKVALCAGVLVLVATAPSLSAASAHTDQAPVDSLPLQGWTGLHITDDLALPWATGFHSDNAGHASPLGMDHDSVLEVDQYEFDDCSRGASSRLFGTDDSGIEWAEDQPLINTDGTPMNGDLDLQGNAFGVSTCDHDLWD